ncbi:signal peptidase II [Dictyobacter aurantiacus]|uniref:Lipoprotein signal peptidase n=1 Tax=Dictyobacter aurantiacus TaxID=1936993 RepID=A0A401ZJP4_9CHLR|nr:signal peptidase II [Dictyobacter aurantiacus]GCE07071.1 lipoprotein signal peptidase [Dictyobacter aurantiacus]
MKTKNELISHLIALLSAICVVLLDQWSKNQVVEHLSPPDSGRSVSLLGDYLSLYYVRNWNSAMGLLTNPALLAVLIVVALVVLISFYWRLFRRGPLVYKILFGLILGGAAGNILDRFIRGGYVVDFIYFRIPQIGFRFYIFNIADAAISVGVALLFILLLFSDVRRPRREDPDNEQADTTSSPTTSGRLS